MQLSLAGAVQQALADNPELGLTVARVEASEALRQQARLGPNPRSFFSPKMPVLAELPRLFCILAMPIATHFLPRQLKPAENGLGALMWLLIMSGAANLSGISFAARSPAELPPRIGRRWVPGLAVKTG
jgi:hypothetical protein